MFTIIRCSALRRLQHAAADANRRAETAAQQAAAAKTVLDHASRTMKSVENRLRANISALEADTIAGVFRWRNLTEDPEAGGSFQGQLALEILRAELDAAREDGQWTRREETLAALLAPDEKVPCEPGHAACPQSPAAGLPTACVTTGKCVKSGKERPCPA